MSGATTLPLPRPQALKDYASGVLVPHLRVHWANWIAIVGAILTFNHSFLISFNVSESLPQSVFLVLKGDKRALATGDYVAFRWVGGGPYKAGMGLLKRIRGVEGDRVETHGRDFYVAGQYVGHAKRLSKTGVPLALGPTGVIPAGHFYMSAPHKDSLDSRYALTGWIPVERVIGRALPLF